LGLSLEERLSQDTRLDLLPEIESVFEAERAQSVTID